MMIARSRFVALTLASLLALTTVAAGCSDGDDDASTDPTEAVDDSSSGDVSDADAAEVGAKAFEDAEFEVSDDVEVCVGRSLISAVGKAQATKIVAEPDLTKLSDDDQELAAASLNECVPGEVMAEGLVSLFTGGLEGLDTDELSGCLAERLDGKVGDSMLEVAAAADEAWITQLFGACPTSSLTAAAVAASLEGSLPPAVVECVSQKVAETVDFGDFAAADADPEAEAELQTKITEAVAACPAS